MITKQVGEINGLVKSLGVALCSVLLFLSFNPSQSQGSYFSIGLRLLSFVALAVLAMLTTGCVPRFNKRLLCVLLIFSAYIISVNIGDMSFLVVIMLSIMWSAGILVSAVNQNRLTFEIIKSACTILLIFWISTLAVQVVVYNATGVMLELHNTIFPYSHSRGHIGGIFTRYPGTQNEPGTYANWIYGVVFLRSLMIGKIGTRLHFLAIFSSIFTLAMWSYVALPFFILATVIENRSAKEAAKLWVGLFIAGTILAVLIAGVAQDYLSMRLDDDGTSINSKKSVYEYMWSNASQWIFHGSPMITDPCNGCLAPQDAGVGINFMYYFGIPIVILMIAFCLKVYKLKSFSGLLVSIPLFLAKYFVLDPITMMIAMFVFYLRWSPVQNIGRRDSAGGTP